MNGTKEVSFRNYDSAAGFFYDDTVEAFVWDNDLAMCSGYWVVDKTITIGDKTGQDPEESHQIVFSGDVKLIVEDGVSLTMRWDDSFKMDAAEMTSAIGDTVNDISSVVADGLSGDWETLATDAGSLVSGITDLASKMIEDNEGTTVAMLSVCEGASLTVYGQENGTGKLDIQAPSKSSSSNEGGAAIGGDSKCSNGAITINGGQVIASSAHQAAAIGGGAKAEGHNITINGGYVNAQNTADKGAGIGGGHNGTANNITINSGYIYAYGYNYGAAIGAGVDRDATNITINGGHVYAEARSGSAAIGGGQGANNGTSGYFTINNGYVEAKGGNVSSEHSPAIGRGAYSGEDITHKELITQVKINGGYVYCRVEADNSEVIGKGYCSNGDSSGLYFKGVYLDTGYSTKEHGGYLGWQNGSIDYFTNKDYKDYIKKGVWLKAYAEQGEDVASGSTFSGDKTSSASGYYADTINGGFYHVASGYYFGNSAASSIKGLNNNGYYIKGGAIFNEGGYLDLYSVTISNNKSLSNGSAVQNGSALGGAIYATGGANGYTVVSCSKFENNVTTGSTGDFRGGAIASEQDILTVTGSTFNSNKTTSKGGAIWANGLSVVIDDSEFSSNYASRGGAIYSEGIHTIMNDTFTGNLAGIAGGAVFASSDSTVIINGSEFEANRAHTYNYDLNTDADTEDTGTHRGGAVYVDGDKEKAEGADVYISSSSFTENYAKQGGALYVAAYGNAIVTNTDFIKNEAGTNGEGGAIYVEDKGTLTLNDVYFSGNRSTIYDKDGNVLTDYCAIYNKGEINFTGKVTADPYWMDKMVNCGWINWDLTGGITNGYFSDMTLFINDVKDGSKDQGAFGLTVNADDLGGISRYVLGRNANFEEMPSSLTRFVLRGVVDEQGRPLEDQVIELNGEAIEYNGKMYQLTSSDKAEDYYEMVLTVTNTAGTPERTGHIVVNKENYKNGTLVAAGNFEGYDFGETEGGIVLVETLGTFQVHDSTFSNNKAVKGGAIYAKRGSAVTLSNVTFSANVSEDGQSGAMYIEEGATATMYGTVTLSSSADTIYNEGELVWNIGLTTQGYVSDFSRIVNAGTMVINCDVDTQYGKYLIAGSGKTASGQVFTVRDSNGNDMQLTVGGSAVLNGDYSWRLYVDPNEKYALCLSIEVPRIVVKEAEKYTLSEGYTIDMDASSAYEGSGQIIEVQKAGSLSTANSAKIVGCSASVSGGAIWNRGTVTLDNTRLFGNEVRYSSDVANSGKGGAIYNAEGATLTITNSTFRGNVAKRGQGGAIADDAAGTITITNTTFAANSAKGGQGGAISIANGSLNLNGVIFNGNTADEGGAISVTGTGSVNLYGNVMLETDTDTIDLGTSGKLTFNLSTSDGSGYISDFSKVSGVVDNTITINVNDSDETTSRYVLADNVSAETYGSLACTVKVPTSTSGVYEAKSISVGGSASYNDHYYSLIINDDDQLILQSMKRLEVNKKNFLESGGQCILENDIDINLSGAEAFDGSGMLISVESDGALENAGTLKFANCSANYAGGVISSAGTVALINAEFTGNKSNANGKHADVGHGGAIASVGDLIIDSSTFDSNNANGTNGGAIAQICEAPTTEGEDKKSITVSDTKFKNNTAANGGAIYAENTDLLLSGDVIFYGNTASGKGGAVYLKGTTATINGDVYLTSETDTIYLADDASTLVWTVGTAANGYVSDFSYIDAADKANHKFTIDATTLAKWEVTGQDEEGKEVYEMTETPQVGKSYILAGNADSASSFGNFILKIATSERGLYATPEITVGTAYHDEDLGLYYTLTVNSDDELALSIINRIVVSKDALPSTDGVYTMDKGDDYNWAGMDQWSGSGAIFEVKDDGTLENKFGATVQNGNVTGNGGAVYSEGSLNLKGTIFSGNQAGGSGGAIYNEGTATLKGVTFKGNMAVGCGGAIYNDEDATLSIGGAIFNGNTAMQAGAIYNLGVLNITGSIMLMEDDDTIVSEGDDAVINWALNDTVALTRNTDFSISDLGKVTSNYYSITLNEDPANQMAGMFKLASNAVNGISVAVSGMSDQEGSPTLTVDSDNRFAAISSADNKIYYELLLADNNDLYFTVDKALFLDDSWGDNETDLAAWFHGNAITGGSTGDGTFFNNSQNAAKEALTTNSTVIVYGRGIDHSTVVNLQGKYTLQAGVQLSDEHAWVNAGTAVRDAVVNWDLTSEDLEADDICISGFEYYKNAPTKIDDTEEYLVRQTITVTADQDLKNYVLARGDLSDAAVSKETKKPTDTTRKYDFTLVTSTDVAGQALTFNDVTEYNGRYYSIYIDDAGTMEEADDELILGVYDKKTITVKVDNVSEIYDGTEHTASYTVIGENLLTSGDTVSVTLDYTDSLTNVGSVDEIKVKSFAILRNGTDDVTQEYKDNGFVFVTDGTGSLEVYKRDVVITSASAEKVYDGTALVDPSYEITGSGFIDGQGATIEVTGSQTEIGSSENTVTCTLWVGTELGNYDITINPGTLSVISDTPITITANSASKMYDGTELTDSGYTYTEGILLAGDVLEVTVDGTITDAGTAYNKVTSYKVMRGTTDVTANYRFNSCVDGVLSVSKRNVTMTSASDSKIYDGTALTNDTITVDGDGFAEGEGATYTVTGTQTDAGSSSNAFAYTLTGETAKEANYNITKLEGTLTVEQRGTITITANSSSKMYDGTALTDSGYTYTEGVLLEGDELVVTVTGTITDAGTAANKVTDYKVMRGDLDVTANYAFTDSVDGVLEVSRRNVTLTSASGGRVYDGTAYTNTDVAVSGDLFADGEGATYKVTGSQTDAGTSINTFSYTLNDGTKADNYNIILDCGTLYVTKRAVTLTSASDTKNYDGTPLENHEVTAENFVEGEGATYKVTGSQTEVGSSDNTFAYKLNENTKADNYIINKVEGELVVARDLFVVEKSRTIETDSVIPGIHVSLGDLTVADGVNVTTSSLYLTSNTNLINNGSFKTELLVVDSVSNEISGNTSLIGQAVISENAELTVDKAQYDKMIAYTQIQSSGKMFVSSNGTGLTQTDIDKLIAKSGISYVSFDDDLTDIHNLNFTADKSMVVHYGNGTGTVENDTIRFNKMSTITFGSSDKTIDLLSGNNKVQLDAGSDATILADLTNVSTVKTGSSVVGHFADIAFAASRNATLDIGKNANITAEAINGTDKKTTLKTGSGSIVSAQDVTLQGAADKIAVGSSNKFIAGTIDFGAGSDKLSVGKSSAFAAESILGADTIEFSSYSTMEIKGNITETKKLSIGNGKSGQIATLKAAEVTGTAANDSFSFGNYNDVELESLDFGEGSDTLKIGNYADVVIGKLDFGDGTSNDSLKIGKGTNLTVTDLDVYSLDNLTMGKDSTLYLGSEAQVFAAQAKWEKYADQIKLA